VGKAGVGFVEHAPSPSFPFSFQVELSGRSFFRELFSSTFGGPHCAASGRLMVRNRSRWHLALVTCECTEEGMVQRASAVCLLIGLFEKCGRWRHCQHAKTFSQAASLGDRMGKAWMLASVRRRVSPDLLQLLFASAQKFRPERLSVACLSQLPATSGQVRLS